MTLHRKIRKSLKWGGLITVVLMAGTAVAGYWYAWRISYTGTSTDYTIAVGLGAIGLSQTDFGTILPVSQPLLGWNATSYPSVASNGAFVWLPFKGNSPGTTTIVFPLWIPILFLAVPTAAAWRLDALARQRRRRVWVCRKCGYDRTGLSIYTACPECGTTPPLPGLMHL